MHLIRSTAARRLSLAAALCLAAPLARVDAQTAPANQPNPSSPPPAAAPSTTTSSDQDQAIVLNPFTVSTERDEGYAATNEISGSRVNAPLKDVPVPIDVITSQFISDIGATDLRSALKYDSGIMLETQNDLENSGGTYAGGPYGPGGVNNPQGLTSNIDAVQLKVRGFVTTNVLRDGFLREASSDAANIDRVEVVYGPNALLYGTGNFGGVVDYLTKQPQNDRAESFSLSVGTYDFLRADFDVTGPIDPKSHLDYRITGAWENSDTNVDYQKNHHYFIAPVVTWSPFTGTQLTVDTEYLNSKQSGYGFQALRAVQGSGATPVNNDQIEATAFYYPPGADPRTFNLSGPDTFNDQQEENIEVKLTQVFLQGHDWIPEIAGLAGFNHSQTNFSTRNVNGEITGPIAAGAPGSDLATTITTNTLGNSLGGQGSNNGNLVFGTLPASVVEYQWGAGHQDAYRNQERLELTAREDVFAGHWYHFDDTVLGGESQLYNDLTSYTYATTPGEYSYLSPTSTKPIHYGVQGDGKGDPGLFENDYNNVNKGWDQAYYLNNYAKLFDSRVILMDGVRRDKMDGWSTNDSVTNPGSAPTISTARSSTELAKSYQNGIMVEITKNLSIYGLKAEGFEPNFGGLHKATDGSPVGANYAKSREEGIKFDFMDGKISGRISHYVITKTSWVAEPWYAPAPMGNPRFNPSKDIVYELSGGFNAANLPGTTGSFAGISSQGAPVQTDPTVISAWNAAVAAGAVYTIPGQANHLYLDASKPTGAAYLDAAFAVNQASGGAWPGWLYQGDSNADPNINNATMDAAGFYNTPLDPAWQVIDQSRGWDGELTLTPTKYFQIVFNATIDSTVKRLDLGAWPQYPNSVDRWAVWYFQNGGFGLDGEPLNVAYTNWQNTSTRTNAGVYPGDDSPRYAWSTFMNYKFDQYIKGLSAGIGGTWHSQEEFFSGVTHGGQNIEQNAAGQPITVWSPSQFLLNGFAKYEWKSWGHGQYVQVNVDNLLNDQKEYGLIYNYPINAKFTYGFAF
ncbi:MAG TPA: TonB-dependent receptor plug domain-containing protein [Opitutaceae bacterium]|jgi:outer membrane receptor protein involved in Fe transport